MLGKKSLIKFKRCIMKLRRCMQFLQPVRPIANDDELDAWLAKTAIVPKGHFAVLAGTSEGEQKRFVVELRCLRNPRLLELLKEAEEVFGFQQEGALVVPCTPQKLQKILGDNR